MSHEILYRSPDLKIFRNGPWGALFNTLVVCFQYKRADQHLDLPGFAEEFFGKFQIDAVFVNCATNEWYQYQGLPKALTTVRSFASAWKRTVTYGSSMGGYAALRFAAAVGARSSIAVAPQYSPRSAVVAGENRFDAFVAQTKFLHENYYRASTNIDNYVIYDPLLKIDERHVAEYRKDANLVPIPIPCGGHTPTILLVELGMLSEFILQLIAGTFSVSSFRALFREGRRSSPQYWKELLDRLGERGRRETAKRVSELRRVHEERGSFNRGSQTCPGRSTPSSMWTTRL